MRINRTFAINPGTPINLFTGSSQPPPKGTPPIYAEKVLVQMLHGASGLAFVMDGIPCGSIPTHADLTAELSAAESYSDSDVDVTGLWIDGTIVADKVAASWLPKGTL